MTSFCPVIRDECKRSECMAWKDSACLIFTFLSVSIQPVDEEALEAEMTARLHLQERMQEQLQARKAQAVPADVEFASVQQLAADLIAFAKSEFPGYDRANPSLVADLFWKRKGIEAAGAMPPEIRLKMEQAALLVGQQVDAERQVVRETEWQRIAAERKAERQRLIDQEMKQLPALIEECVSWAIDRGMKRLVNHSMASSEEMRSCPVT